MSLSKKYGTENSPRQELCGHNGYEDVEDHETGKAGTEDGVDGSWDERVGAIMS